ncbi:MAG: hypothetical protein LC723_12580, partial [Actinobacteria bacterium]|nr:hypothetical protein [Actinomycetota bacterium]
YNGLLIMDIATNRILKNIPGFDRALGPKLLLDSTRHVLYAAFWADIIQVFDTLSETVVGQFSVGDIPNSLTVNPTTGRLYVTLPMPQSGEFGDPGYLLTIDEQANTIIDRTPINSTPAGIAAWPGHWRLFIGDEFGLSIQVMTEDAIAPVSTINAQTPTTLHPGQSITGSVTDDYSGVDKVRVTFTSALGATTKNASVTCSANLLSCTWTTNAPSSQGIYDIQVQGMDRAGTMEQAWSPTAKGPTGPHVIATVL